MPFRKKKNLENHWKTKKKSFKKNKHGGGGQTNGTRNLDMRTKFILPIYLLPSCFKNVI